ncbi:esterase family protein [Deinococcus sp. QL22]|uniref:alpha/beta hydrolase n=1 Tax=Deinococcus sp. QL22 TaxID=2939437 RepID=UPI0020174CED|nr:alpha/beta hydrolase-fold protein [Deinococcus sp. QL22]UQN06471.1 alpha/beta hydrolase-fold protein [Deinococcus sp. QL22]
MRFPSAGLSAVLMTLTLLSPATAGGAGGPRPLLPDFSAVTPWPVDCDSAPYLTDGCRLRVALPPGTTLPSPGQLQVVPGHNRLAILYHPPIGTRAVTLCCGLQLPLSPLPGTEVWAVTVKVNDLTRAVISMGVLTDSSASLAQETTWRGPQAPAPVARTRLLAGKVDRLVLDSGSLIGSREIIVYTPPNWTQAERLPAVYLGDGQAVVGLAQTLEPAMLSGAAPRVVLVGIDSARSQAALTATGGPPVDQRAQEYLEAWEGGEQRFAAHEQFVLTTVLPHVERAYGLSARPQDRVVSGFSNGGSWAISMAARHPDVFRGVLAMSPSNAGLQNAPHPAARVFVEGGTLEPSFLAAARTYAVMTRTAGNPTRLDVRVGGHDALVWAEVFPAGVAFILGR